MRRRVFATSLMTLFGAATPVVAAEFWISQDPETKTCNIDETMPDGKTLVMIGATSYPTKEMPRQRRRLRWKLANAS